MEISSIITNHDAVVKQKHQDGSKNAVYTSPEIQNELLDIMGNIVQDKIINSVKEAKLFSILVDETKDISKVEEIAIIVRFIDNVPSVNELFLTYIPAKNLTAA